MSRKRFSRKTLSTERGAREKRTKESPFRRRATSRCRWRRAVLRWPLAIRTCRRRDAPSADWSATPATVASTKIVSVSVFLSLDQVSRFGHHSVNRDRVEMATMVSMLRACLMANWRLQTHSIFSVAVGQVSVKFSSGIISVRQSCRCHTQKKDHHFLPAEHVRGGRTLAAVSDESGTASTQMVASG